MFLRDYVVKLLLYDVYDLLIATNILSIEKTKQIAGTILLEVWI